LLLLDRLEIRGAGVDIAAPLASVTVEEAVGGGRSVIRLSDGGMCAFNDASFSDQSAAALGKRKGPSLIRRWEKSFVLSAAALLIVAATVAAAVQYGVPSLSRKVAFLVSPDVEKRLGEESLVTLDKLVFKPSGLPEEEADRIGKLFHDVAREASLGDGVRVLLRKGGPLGANAVALPGIVVMTDEMVLLAKDDWEIAAVLAHEAGHIRARHGLRHLLQNSMTALIVSLAIGDLASISSLAATAPTLLINAKYSRDFEREADAAAAHYLQSRGVSLQKFADVLEKLEADHKRRGKTESKIESYMSSHPPVRERVEELFNPRRGSSG
jgi:Zn-dependent protease with chaperone function